MRRWRTPSAAPWVSCTANPLPTEAQREQRGQRYSIDFEDLDFLRTFTDSVAAPWSHQQRYSGVCGGVALSGQALYDCEVQVDDWVGGQLEALDMQPRAWRFVLTGRWPPGPALMLNRLSRDCQFWEWRLGVVEEQRPRLEHLDYKMV